MQTVNLQYAPIGVKPVIHVSQFDVGRTFKLIVYDGSEAYSIPNNATTVVNGLKPDKTAFSYSDAVSINGNEITVTTKAQMTVLEGRVECEIRISQTGSDIGTINFILEVEKSPLNGDVDISETELPAIIALASQQEANAAASAEAAAGSESAAAASAEAAAGSESAAAASAEDAEAWAVGERGGTAVDSSDETYENNSKYYSEESASSATAAAASESNAFDSEQAAKLSEQNAKASEDILEYYATFAIPRFVIANNRLYISDNSVGNFIVANNRLYIQNAS